MNKSFKFALPSPNFNKKTENAYTAKRHYLTPSGMSLLPREKQPPPMYGKQGATVPSRYLKRQIINQEHFVSSDISNPPEKQYCENCEMDLQSLDDLKRHRAQHEKCPVDGCVYKGHPSVMDKHVNALHSSGLFDKFKKLSTPEEIAAWREERRKRYPTVANVQLKQKAREQRQKRGERLETNKTRFGQINDRKRALPSTPKDNHMDEKKQRDEVNPNNKNRKGRKNKMNRKSKNQCFDKRAPRDVNQIKENVIEDAKFSCGGIQIFKGTSQLKNYKHFNEKKKAITNNALFGLVGMYGSGDESDESDSGNDDCNVDECYTVNINKNIQRNSNKPLDKYNEISECLHTDSKVKQTFENSSISNADTTNHQFSKSQEIDCPSDATTIINVPLIGNAMNENIIDVSIETATSKENGKSSDEAPEEKPILRNMPNCPQKSENSIKTICPVESENKRSKLTEHTPRCKEKQRTRRKFGLDYRKARLRKQNTMLEKLLEADIRHERNVLLQCVRFVCENNFFNIGQSREQEPIDTTKS